MGRAQRAPPESFTIALLVGLAARPTLQKYSPAKTALATTPTNHYTSATYPISSGRFPMPASTANSKSENSLAPQGLAWTMAAMIVALPAGCVERRMTIRSNPPGAMLYVDDYPVGITPIATSFIYYGRTNLPVKDGYARP